MEHFLSYLLVRLVNNCALSVRLFLLTVDCLLETTTCFCRHKSTPCLRWRRNWELSPTKWPNHSKSILSYASSVVLCLLNLECIYAIWVKCLGARLLVLLESYNVRRGGNGDDKMKTSLEIDTCICVCSTFFYSCSCSRSQTCSSLFYCSSWNLKSRFNYGNVPRPRSACVRVIDLWESQSIGLDTNRLDYCCCWCAN